MSKLFEVTDKTLKSPHLAVMLIDLCLMRGINQHKLLKGTQLFYDDICKGEIFISPLQLFKLIENSQKLLNNHDMSFLLGRRFFPGNLGAISNVLLNAKNLSEMLKIIMCFQPLLFPLMFVQYKQYNDKTYLIINHAFGEFNDKHAIFMAELFCSILVSVIKLRFGQNFPIAFKFPYSQPSHIEEYQVSLGENLQFDQHILMIGIENKYLNLQLQDSSKTLKSLYLSKCKKQRNKQAGLIQHILIYLDKNTSATLEQSASYLKISPATFKRKLKQHNTSFQQLLDLVKKQAAIYQITIEGSNNNNVSHTLKFNDATNFRRAFKRWTGMTPNTLRKI